LNYRWLFKSQCSILVVIFIGHHAPALRTAPNIRWMAAIIIQELFYRKNQE
jgi:hypothetical protein